MNYFKECKTQADLKKRYRELCKRLHPDNGGNAAEFVEMQKEFEEAANGNAWRTFENASGETYTKDVNESPAEFMKTIETLLNLDGVNVEICGSWLWITGKTYNYKNTIKQLGGRWSKNKNAWYIHHEAYRKRSKKRMTLDEIRAIYGSTTFKKEEREKIAAAG